MRSPRHRNNIWHQPADLDELTEGIAGVGTGSQGTFHGVAFGEKLRASPARGHRNLDKALAGMQCLVFLCLLFSFPLFLPLLLLHQTHSIISTHKSTFHSGWGWDLGLAILVILLWGQSSLASKYTGCWCVGCWFDCTWHWWKTSLFSPFVFLRIMDKAFRICKIVNLYGWVGLLIRT